MTTPASKTTSSGLAAHVILALELLLKAAAISVPVLYAMGRLYSETYWDTLGIPSSLMAYTVKDYLYFGFVANFVGLAKTLGAHPYSALGYAVMYAFVISIGVVIVLLIDGWFNARLEAKKTELEQRAEVPATRQVTKTLARGIAVWSALTGGFAMLIGVSLLVLLPAVFAVKAGQARAQAELARQTHAPATSSQVTPSALAYFTRDGVLASGALVECSESWCVVFDRGFIAVPRDTVTLVGSTLRGKTGH